MPAQPAAIGSATNWAQQLFNKEADIELKPILSKKAHQKVLAEIERLWDAAAKSAAADRFDVLTMPTKVLLKPHRRRREAGELETA